MQQVEAFTSGDETETDVFDADNKKKELLSYCKPIAEVGTAVECLNAMFSFF